jgi:predicted phage tail protein
VTAMERTYERTFHELSPREQHERIVRHEVDELSVKDIVGGITEDFRHFVNLQVEAIKLDVRKEIALAKQATIAGAIGGAVLAVGALFLLVALAWLLATADAIPVWGGFAIVGMVTTLGGVASLLRARSKAKQIEVPPPAVEEAKEDLQWIKRNASA